MATTEGFEQMVLGVDLAEQASEAQTREQRLAVQDLQFDLRDTQNREIIQLGDKEVRSGRITSANLAEIAIETVNMQLYMMRELVIIEDQVFAEDGPSSRFEATSRRIDVGDDTEVALRQRSVFAADAKDFLTFTKKNGPWQGLLGYALPRTTAVVGFRKGAEEAAIDVPLTIVAFDDKDKLFRSGWAPYVRVLETLPAAQSRVVRGRNSQTIEDRDLSSTELTFVAGEIVRFTHLLDRIRAQYSD